MPYEDREYFQKLSTARFDLAGGGGAALDAVGESLEYLGGLIVRQRKEPGDGLLGPVQRFCFENDASDEDLDLGRRADHRQAGDHGHPEAGGDERLHGAVVVGGERHPRVEADRPAGVPDDGEPGGVSSAVT